jgi:hypothetical protein
MLKVLLFQSKPKHFVSKYLEIVWEFINNYNYILQRKDASDIRPAWYLARSSGLFFIYPTGFRIWLAGYPAFFSIRCAAGYPASQIGTRLDINKKGRMIRQNIRPAGYPYSASQIQYPAGWSGRPDIRCIPLVNCFPFKWDAGYQFPLNLVCLLNTKRYR